MSPHEFDAESSRLLNLADDLDSASSTSSSDLIALRRELSTCIDAGDRLGEAVADRRMAELLYALGKVEQRSGRIDEARPHFDRARTRDLTYKRAVLALVEIDHAAKRAATPEDTDDFLDYAAFGSQPRVLRSVHMHLRDSLRIKLTEDPDAIDAKMEALERLHRECPKINYPKQYLGRGLYLRREYRRAIDVLGSFTEEKAESPSLLNMIGRSHEKLGEIEAAAAAYTKSLSQDEQQAGILFRLGRLKLLLAQIGR